MCGYYARARAGSVVRGRSTTASQPALRGSIEAHWRAVPICSDEKRPLSDAWREIERRAEGKSKRAEARELHGGCASGFA
jgi:hypothetical protein